MSSEERPDSLAAQAAAWVPPWERRREPDPDFPASIEESEPAAPDPGPSASAPGRGSSPTEITEMSGEKAEAPQSGPVDSPPFEAAPEPDQKPAEPEPVAVIPEPEPVAAGAEPVAVQPEPDQVLIESEPAPEPVAVGLEPAPGPVAVQPEPVTAEPEPEQVSIEPEPEPVAVEPEPGVRVPDRPARGPEVAASVPTQPRRPREGAAVAVQSAVRTPAPVSMDDAELAAALESIMLVVDEPVGELQLAQVLEQPVERIARSLENVSARYTAAGHGIDLRRVAGGWRLYTRPEYAAYVERFVLDGQSVRLTQAALETLAVVAYKQPVTRSRISAIRGVNCDGVMRTLVTRGLIEECGTEPETGAYLYRTTPLFLEKLGLNSVDQLPPLAPFLPDDVEEVLDASG